MGNKIVHVGGHGMGTSMKMVINLLIGNAMAAFAEGMALGEGLGISRKVLFDSLLGMPAVAPFLAAKREKIETGNYDPEFPLRWMQKDLHLASVSAYESDVAMPLTNAARTISARNARRACDGRFLGYLRLPLHEPFKRSWDGCAQFAKISVS
jgi:3-hydroxyisobutyrate dehydrogenase-like beta-hydroxyacid dehydrogenase